MENTYHEEEVPSVYDFTSLTQIWKKKGSQLSLNNHRFVHMKCWRAKLLEALITEKTNIQIGQGNAKSPISRTSGDTQDLDEAT